jgi:hypothetical protein
VDAGAGGRGEEAVMRGSYPLASSLTASKNSAPIFVPSPLAGEGNLEFQQTRLGEGALRLSQAKRPLTQPNLRHAQCSPLPQPKSGIPDFGHTIGRPKSETSDFGWERAQIQGPQFMTQ